MGQIDEYIRLALVEVLDDKKALRVMFAVLKSFSMLKNRYKFETEEVMTNNGAVFGRRKFSKNKESHPFEQLLAEMEIKYRYTKF